MFSMEAYLSIIMNKYSSILNGLAELSSFSDGCKKKFLLDSVEQGHLVWGRLCANWRLANTFHAAFHAVLPLRRSIR